ncbi:MAG: HAD-IA family hydrolase [Terriglobales bacterium]
MTGPAFLPPAGLALLIFDLDGTLIDSRADLAQSVNAMLRHLGRTPLPEAVVAEYVGDGAPLLVRRALGLLPAPDRTRPSQPPPGLEGAAQRLAEEGLEYFLAYYTEHMLDRTTLYPGVAAGLAALAGAGFALAVLSNKPERPSREIVGHLGVARYFLAVHGGNSFEQKKPDPVGIRALLAASGLAPRAAAMIGDSAVDVRAGRNAGTWTCGVTYGFMPATLALEPPDWTAASFAELSLQLLAARTAVAG